MSAITTATYSAYSSAVSLFRAASGATDATTGQAPAASTSSNPVDVVDLSNSASATQTQAPPVAKTTSQKSFAEVTADARATLDSKYAELREQGRPFNFRTSSGQDWDTVFKGLDRRSLYAVASNSNGLFSEDEQQLAQSYLTKQAVEVVEAADPLHTDIAAREKAYIKFLDGVSEEEKTSDNWAIQRATAQHAYESEIRYRSGTPENVDSGNPLVKVILAAIESVRNQTPRATSYGGYVKDLKDEPLFKDGYFADQIAKAKRELKAQQRIDVTV